MFEEVNYEIQCEELKKQNTELKKELHRYKDSLYKVQACNATMDTKIKELQKEVKELGEMLGVQE